MRNKSHAETVATSRRSGARDRDRDRDRDMARGLSISLGRGVEQQSATSWRSFSSTCCISGGASGISSNNNNNSSSSRSSYCRQQVFNRCATSNYSTPTREYKSTQLPPSLSSSSSLSSLSSAELLLLFHATSGQQWARSRRLFGATVATAAAAAAAATFASKLGQEKEEKMASLTASVNRTLGEAPSKQQLAESAIEEEEEEEEQEAKSNNNDEHRRQRRKEQQQISQRESLSSSSSFSQDRMMLVSNKCFSNDLCVTGEAANQVRDEQQRAKTKDECDRRQRMNSAAEATQMLCDDSFTSKSLSLSLFNQSSCCSSDGTRLLQEKEEALFRRHVKQRATSSQTYIQKPLMTTSQQQQVYRNNNQLNKLTFCNTQAQQVEEVKFNSRYENRKSKSSFLPSRARVRLAQLVVLIYIVFTYSVSMFTIPAAATTTSAGNSYWPLRSRQQQQHQQQQQQQRGHAQAYNEQTQANNNNNAQQQQQQNPILQPKSHQLMIGQHYNNFSSIIPYSIVQDSEDDYGNSASSMQEDQILDELPEAEQQQVQLQQQLQQLKHQQQQQQQQQRRQQFEATVNGAGDTRTITTATATATDAAAATIINNDDESSPKTMLLKSRALLPLDSNRLILPQMQQIKSRFNQGCVGGTKCQFFAFCWMSGGSLGASCGLLMTCCVTPSRQEIQPGFYGPVVNDPYCGRSTSKINRIVGGTDASFGQFPWQAFVQVGGSRCGGALISSRHVVTAGHCVARSQHSPSSIKVTLGDYILNSDIESIPHEVFSVVEVLLHPNFRFTPQADRYDVAVLELDRAASYKDNIKPICLPQKDAAFVGRVAYVAGWGALQAGSKLRPKVLQHVAVPVIENHVCESWHRRKGIDIRIYDEMMCAGYELGQRDACQGDSGGPLMLNQFGVWYLVGIVSAGYSCAKQYQPGIYHRVSSSSDWISSNIYQQQGAN